MILIILQKKNYLKQMLKAMSLYPLFLKQIKLQKMHLILESNNYLYYIQYILTKNLQKKNFFFLYFEIMKDKNLLFKIIVWT